MRLILLALLTIMLASCETGRSVDGAGTPGADLPEPQDLIIGFQQDPAGSRLKYRGQYDGLSQRVGFLSHQEKVVLVVLAGEMAGAGDPDLRHKDILFSYLGDDATKMWALQGLQYLDDSESAEILLDELNRFSYSADSIAAFNAISNRMSRQCTIGHVSANWCEVAKAKIRGVCSLKDFPDRFRYQCNR